MSQSATTSYLFIVARWFITFRLIQRGCTFLGKWRRILRGEGWLGGIWIRWVGLIWYCCWLRRRGWSCARRPSRTLRWTWIATRSPQAQSPPPHPPNPSNALTTAPLASPPSPAPSAAPATPSTNQSASAYTATVVSPAALSTQAYAIYVLRQLYSTCKLTNASCQYVQILSAWSAT